jgi:hypothetical protein
VRHFITDLELQSILNKLREYTLTKRQAAFSRHAIFFLGVINVVCCLTEIGMYEPRPITKEEEHWFKGGYHMNFWDAEIEQTLYNATGSRSARKKVF